MRSIHMCLRLGVAVLAGCAFAAAHAADAPLSAIRAGRLVDVRNGKVVTDQVILVRGDRIEAVGASNAVAIPAGTKVIDLSAYTVLPGLIDAHTHITSDPTLPPFYGYGMSVPRIALKGATYAKRTLLAGITTIRDVGVCARATFTVSLGVSAPAPHHSRKSAASAKLIRSGGTPCPLEASSITR